MNLSAPFVARPVATTLLAIGHGAGAELRQPLGITIVGGLLFSQLITLFTTPVVYVALDKLSRGKHRYPIKATEGVMQPAP